MLKDVSTRAVVTAVAAALVAVAGFLGELPLAGVTAVVALALAAS